MNVEQGNLVDDDVEMEDSRPDASDSDSEEESACCPHHRIPPRCQSRMRLVVSPPSLHHHRPGFPEEDKARQASGSERGRRDAERPRFRGGRGRRRGRRAIVRRLAVRVGCVWS
jgi:hypothetical protein